MHHPCLSAVVVHRQLDESDQLISFKSANKDTGFRESRTHLSDRFQALSIMREPSALSNWTLIVNFPNSASQSVIKRNFANKYSLFCCLFGFIPRFESNLLIPPIVERCYGQGGHIVPYHFEWIFNSCLGNWPDECEQIKT